MWLGLSGLGVYLQEGDYWLAFEVRGSQTFDGAMPDGITNDPVWWALKSSSEYGNGYPDNEWGLRSGNIQSIGARIYGNPVPIPAASYFFAASISLIYMTRLAKKGRSVSP